MRETKKNIKRYSKRFSKKIKNNKAGTRKWAFPATRVSVKMSVPMFNSPQQLIDIGERSSLHYKDNSDKIYVIKNFKLCAIYSNPICLIRPITNEISSIKNPIYVDHTAPLRTQCQEMKALSLNSKSENLKFLPAAEKKDIFNILQGNADFYPEILFISCHSYNNKILCEDANGRFVVFKHIGVKRLFISEELSSHYFISKEEFVKIIKSGRLKNLKLLFLNACKMQDFAEFVSKELSDIYVICWNTDAEDVACLDFQKKLIIEINKIEPSERIIDENVYIKAAESLIEDYGTKYKVDRIQDPKMFMDKPDLLQQIRPSGLNCLFYKGVIIASLDSIKQRLAKDGKYNKFIIDEPPPLIDRPYSTPKSRSMIKGKSI